ncbi:MAG: hypothetical protein F4213_14845 [Boseongicola sp. SB0677_bin_26]|nr:hypothetical protein [Boseongicola sp. SB0665_bin_10]MYG27278.1 hypothetical protein [Boseongicola sp. SB0677_bin_26]
MDIWQLLTFVATGICLYLAWIAYYRPRKRQRLQYQTAAIQYFDEDDYALPSDAAMTFRGESVARLAKARLIVWNGGTDALRGDDIVKHDPLRIRLASPGKILSHSIVGTPNEGNLVSADERPGSQGEILLTYDYLNPGDGAVIQVLHDSKQRAPVLAGAAKGLSDGPQALGTVTLHDIKASKKRRNALRTMFALGLVVLLLGVIRTVPLSPDDYSRMPSAIAWLVGDERNLYLSTMLIILGLAYMSLPSYAFVTGRPRFPKSLRRFVQEPQDGS